MVLVLALGCASAEAPVVVDNEGLTVDRDRPTVGEGPAVEDTIDQRRAVVLALLTDGGPARELPTQSTDFLIAFDPDLGRTGSMLYPSTPNASGPLELDVVRRRMRQIAEDLRLCYDQRLDDLPTLSGAVTLRFRIRADGSVTSSTAETTLEDRAVGRCMAEVIRGTSFPRSTGPTRVAYALDLVPPPLL
jgi:hypothetical protein